MDIRTAKISDAENIVNYDKHISPDELVKSVRLERVYIAEDGGRLAGWVRYNLFWDNTPFLNMLFVLDKFRGKGIGKTLMNFWEQQMRMNGFSHVMTSSQQNEYAQHFYIKCGYKAVGGFIPYDEGYEIIFSKAL